MIELFVPPGQMIFFKELLVFVQPNLLELQEISHMDCLNQPAQFTKH